MFMPSISRGDFFDDLFENLWLGSQIVKNGGKLTEMKGIMQTDIRELDEGYEFVINLPGFEKEDIEAIVENGYLTVSASKESVKEENKDNSDIKEEDSTKEKKEQGTYICRERYTGSCKRSFYVGNTLTRDDIKASFNAGILTIDVPKKSNLTKEEKQIKIA